MRGFKPYIKTNKEAKQLLEKYAKQFNTRYIWRLYIWALVKDQNWGELEELVDNLQITTLSDDKDPRYFYYEAVRWLVLLGHDDHISSFLTKGL